MDSSIIFILIMIAVFFIFLILPQRRQQKQREEFLKSLKAGDKVITTGGIYGEVYTVKDNIVTLTVAKDTRIRIMLDGILRNAENNSSEAAVKGSDAKSKDAFKDQENKSSKNDPLP